MSRAEAIYQTDKMKIRAQGKSLLILFSVYELYFRFMSQHISATQIHLYLSRTDEFSYSANVYLWFQFIPNQLQNRYLIKRNDPERQIGPSFNSSYVGFPIYKTETSL